MCRRGGPSEEGSGAHTKAKLRLFGAKEEEVRVTLYRDHAAWQGGH